MIYKFEVWNPATGERIADLSGLAKSRSFSVAKNTAPNISFSLDLSNFETYCSQLGVYPEDVLKENQYDIRVYRDGTPIVGAEIRSLPFKIDAAGKSIDVKAVGILDRLAKCYAGFSTIRVFSSTDMGTILKTIIDEFQALTDGDMNITTNAAYIEATFSTAISYDCKPIKTALIEAASQGDLDFEFTHDRKFYVYNGMGQDRTATIFLEYPKNIQSLSGAFDGVPMINSVKVKGNGDGTTQLSQVVTDTTKRAEYGLLQGVIEATDVESTTLLGLLGTEELARKVDGLRLPSFSLDGNFARLKTDYWIGDTIRLAIKDSRFLERFNGDWIIEAINVSIDDAGAEKVDITVREP